MSRFRNIDNGQGETCMSSLINFILFKNPFSKLGQKQVHFEEKRKLLSKIYLFVHKTLRYDITIIQIMMLIKLEGFLTCWEFKFLVRTLLCWNGFCFNLSSLKKNYPLSSKDLSYFWPFVLKHQHFCHIFYRNSKIFAH